MLALDPYYEMFPSSYQRPYPYWSGLGQLHDAAAAQRAQNAGIDYGVDYTVVQTTNPAGNLFRVTDFYEDPSTLKLFADVSIRLNPNFKRGLRFPIQALRRATEADRLLQQRQLDPFVGDPLPKPPIGPKIALGVGLAVLIGAGTFLLGRFA